MSDRPSHPDRKDGARCGNQHGKRIEHGVIAEVREKVANLEVAKGLSVRTALVYDGTLSPSVEADRYFDFILSFDKLLRE